MVRSFFRFVGLRILHVRAAWVAQASDGGFLVSRRWWANREDCYSAVAAGIADGTITRPSGRVAYDWLPE